MKANDITGRRFGRLTAMDRLPNAPSGHSIWQCHCECGAMPIIRGSALVSGHTISCGCAQKQAATIQGLRNERHGHNRRAGRSPTYLSWLAMLARCENAGHTHYENYGGRGIKVCPQWHDFTAFLADMGERPAGHTLDRINNDAGYEPGNCRWSTRLEQNRNRRDRRAA